MTIQILGPGCANCQNLEKNVRTAIEQIGLDAGVEKVTDVDQIIEMGVMRTPGYAVDGIPVGSGKVFTAEEVAEKLKAYK